MRANLLPLKEVAKAIGVKYSTIRQWIKHADAPFIREGHPVRIMADPDAVRSWADSRNLTGELGRPEHKQEEGSEDPQYWLGRLRKVKALEAEGAVISKADHLSLLSNLAATAASKLRKLPVAAAPGCYGKSIEEVEAELDRFVQDICVELSDPNNYEPPETRTDLCEPE